MFRAFRATFSTFKVKLLENFTYLVGNCTSLGRLFLSVDESETEKKGDEEVEKKADEQAEASKNNSKKDDGLAPEKKAPRRGSMMPQQRQVLIVWHFFQQCLCIKCVHSHRHF